VSLKSAICTFPPNGEFAREILDADDVKKRWLPCCDSYGYFTKFFIKFGFFVFDLWIFEGEEYFRRVQKYVLHRCHSFRIVGME
jgi:hypothetical protein